MESNVASKSTKIVATIGPASWDEDVLREMVLQGMNVARINFSHGEHEQHAKTIATVRKLAEEMGRVIGVLCDIQGPKIRVGKIANEPLAIEDGDSITLTLDAKADGTHNIVHLPHPEFLKDIQADDQLLLDDGDLEFVVKEARADSLVCEVVIGGNLFSRKGVMSPTAELTLPAITDKDRKDIEFALQQETDYLAMSFVRHADDIRQLRWLMNMLGGEAAVVAKIEKHEALRNIEEIIDVCEGIMVARGDLGIETPAEEVPLHQKRIIRLCNEVGKPVITATQMLSSMKTSPRPTRAEASDVYNAILDGTDAVMLSNESAMGKYPVEAVQMMTKIALAAEENFLAARRAIGRNVNLILTEQHGVSDTISAVTYQISEAIDAAGIISTTMSGHTPRMVAKERPTAPIFCMTPNTITYRRMALVWGVYPILVDEFGTIDEMIHITVRAAYNKGLVNRGDSVVIIAGVPFSISGQTNLIKVHRVGEYGEL